MQKEEAYFLHLLSGYIDNTLSKEEVKELFNLIAENQAALGHFLNNPQIKEKLETLAVQGRHEIPDLLSNRMRDRLLSAIEISEIQKGIPHVVPENQPNPVFLQARIRRLIFSRIAAAAVILLIIAPAAYLIIQSRNNKIVAPIQTVTTVSDITPGIHKPVLTLSGGQQIILDSTSTQTISKLSNTNIIAATSDHLTYEHTTTANATDFAKTKIKYNTLTNPRGSMVANLTLSDGTKVWLNAGSSITYPVAFNESNRDVEITGEAYFEVTKNPHRPFTVKRKNSDINVTVLGTHFNVNMYDDESENKITLLEGSVRVSSSSKNQMLTPGQQAKVSNSNITLIKEVDLESIMAWKNGQFLLKGTDLARLLRQVSRWYDVDIENKKNYSSIKFGGSISRNVNLSTVVEALKINGVNCSMNGKKLIVE
jgi:transmembrane sensor